MRLFLAPLIGLLAALALIASVLGHGFAQARPRAVERFELVLCADGGERTVAVDANGNPVDPDRCDAALCPDCIATPPLALAGAPSAIRLEAGATRARPARQTRGATHHRQPAPLPRGPPNPV